MTQNKREYSSTEVYEVEINEEIVQRRRLAGLAQVGADDKTIAADAERSLVGLAFSGGGIRAAAFCLGVLQAFQAKRIMRYVDYLSTVSGGGYVGSLFSSLVNHPQGQRAWRRQIVPANGNAATTADGVAPDTYYSIDSEDGGRQSLLVRRIANSGPNLRRPVWFGSAYFFGLTLTNFVALPGLLAATILAAICFRSLDYPPVAYSIDGLGFKGDFARAFFPSFVLMLCWATCMIIGNAVQSLSVSIRIARGVFVLLVASLAMAIASLIGTGDIDVTVLTKWLGVDSSKQYMVPTASRIGALFVLLIALLPYLRLHELVRSGVRPRNFMDRWVFAVASTALLCGVPLVLFGYFASENISGFNPDRVVKIANEDRDIALESFEFSESSTIAPIFFVDWSKFWLTVESSAKPPSLQVKVQQRPGLEPTRRAADKVLWAIANGKELSDVETSPDSAPPDEQANGVFQARSAQADVIQSVGKAMLRNEDPSSTWYLPTDDADLLRAQELSPDSKNATVIDLEQDIQAESDDYNSQSILRKWWYLTGLPWRNGNSLAAQVERVLKKRQRDEAICRRLNYQFVSNPFMAAALLRDLSTVVETSSSNIRKADVASPDPVIHRAIGALDRSAAAAAVRRFSAALKTAESLEQEVVRIQDAKAQGDDLYLQNFLQWQGIKHQLLCLRGDPTAAADVRRKSLMSELGKTLGRAKAPSHRQRDYEALEVGIREFNLAVLSELLYPETLRPQSTVYSSVVLADDQKSRWRMFAWSLGTFLIASLVINLNFTSIHSYYQSVLSKIWIVGLPGLGSRIPLAQLDNTRVGAPYHLLHGTVRLRPHAGREPSSPLSGFLFSKRFCGGIEGKYVATAEYRNLDLPTAMAISGAAITPSAVNNQLVWAIMFLCNFRTGQWLAWPGKVATGMTRALYRFASQMAGMAWQVMLNRCLPSSRQSMAFVYDGGLYENLGVEPLLARRCRLIIAVDASEDAESRFEDFQSLVQRSRSRYGINIQALEPNQHWMAPLTPKFCSFEAASQAQKKSFADRLTTHGYIFFRINYPPSVGANSVAAEETQGTLIYLRPSLAATLCSPEVLGFARNEPEFPQDSSINQFYTSLQFDAYRSLGGSIGAGVAREISERIQRAGGILPDVADWQRPIAAAGAPPVAAAAQEAVQPREPAELQDPHLRVPPASKENLAWLIQVCSSHTDELVRQAAAQSLVDPNGSAVLERAISTGIAKALLDRDFSATERARILKLVAEHRWRRGVTAIWAAVEQLLGDRRAEPGLRAAAFEMLCQRKSASWIDQRQQELAAEGPDGELVLQQFRVRPPVT